MSIKTMSEYVFYAKYAKYLENKKRRETWQETVARVFDMHNKFLTNKLGVEKLPEELQEYIDFAKLFVKQKKVLGSQRALQFGGEPILKHNEKIYNCSALYIDRVRAFQETLYLLLNGCGVGVSIQQHHIEQLPNISKPTNGNLRWVVDDSIEGWADAVGVLMTSYFDIEKSEFDSSVFGKNIVFDFSRVRPEGSMISGGFLAPGPKGLESSLEKIKNVLENRLTLGENKLHSIDVYDIIMHSADAVLSGGVRRSASIVLFSKDDEEMLNAKTGNWFETNPQRGRSNNSVVLKRDECKEEDFLEIIQKVKEFGEPGFVFVDDYETLVNPCCLTGDTCIETKNGIKTLENIVNDFNNGILVEVVSYNIKDDTFEYKQLKNALLTREKAEIIKLDFGENKILKLTKDHRVLKNDNTYVEAGVLKIGDKVKGLFSETQSSDEYELLSFCEIPNEDVYDIEVVDNHNFVANGLIVHNCEISFNCHDEITGETGVSFCNLCEINMKKCKNEEDFYSACKASAIIGTIQAAYTNFDYLTEASKNIVDKEALLGISMTGMMDSPEIAFNDGILKKGAKIIKKINKQISSLIGINQSARTTCVKPSGCMVSDTKLKTSLGVKSIKELFELNNYDWSEIQTLTDTFLPPTQKIFIKNENNKDELITNLYVNRVEDELIEIEFEDGIKIKCTTNHKFKLLHNEWKEAKDLSVGLDYILNFEPTDEFFYKRINSIERIKNTELTFDIEVSGSHTYQLENGCVTHNTSSLLLGSSSGIHPHHAKRYFRRIQANVNEFPLKEFKKVNPTAIEKSVWSNTGTDEVIIFPCEVPIGSIVKNQINAIDFLEKVKTVQENWIEFGTNGELCIKPYLRHNVSNTINVKPEEWEDVARYLYENRNVFTGVSLLSVFGDKDLPQTPLTTVYTSDEISKQYGNAAMFASGLIVHAQRAFSDNLWKACNCVVGLEQVDESNSEQVKWIERVKKFADKYFDGDVKRVTYLLKDVDNLKLWCDLLRDIKDVDWSKVEEPNPYFTAVDTTAGAACSGGKCDSSFELS